MAGTNGHDPAGPNDTVTADELDGLLAGLFEPTPYELAPGRWIEIRPLILANADRLYMGGLQGAGLQKFLLARCVYINGKVLGEAGADRLPIGLASRLVPVVMGANGMEIETAAAEGEATTDPKA